MKIGRSLAPRTHTELLLHSLMQPRIAMFYIIFILIKRELCNETAQEHAYTHTRGQKSSAAVNPRQKLMV